MVMITRSLARLLRAVLRKTGLGKSGSQPDAFVHVSADNEGLRLRVAGPEVAVEYRQPGEFGTAAFMLPGRGPGIIDGLTQEPVTFDAPDPGRIAISFAEHAYRSCSNEPSTVKPNSPLGPSYRPPTPRMRLTCGQRCATPWPRPTGNRPGTR